MAPASLLLSLLRATHKRSFSCWIPCPVSEEIKTLRAVLESVGIKNVLAKSKGSSNPHNLVKATIGALCELRDAYSVAQLRGISLNQVFNG